MPTAVAAPAADASIEADALPKICLAFDKLSSKSTARSNDLTPSPAIATPAAIDIRPKAFPNLAIESFAFPNERRKGFESPATTTLMMLVFFAI